MSTTDLEFSRWSRLHPKLTVRLLAPRPPLAAKTPIISPFGFSGSGWDSTIPSFSRRNACSASSWVNGTGRNSLTPARRASRRTCLSAREVVRRICVCGDDFWRPRICVKVTMGSVSSSSMIKTSGCPVLWAGLSVSSGCLAKSSTNNLLTISEWSLKSIRSRPFMPFSLLHQSGQSAYRPECSAPAATCL